MLVCPSLPAGGGLGPVGGFQRLAAPPLQCSREDLAERISHRQEALGVLVQRAKERHALALDPPPCPARKADEELLDDVGWQGRRGPPSGFVLGRYPLEERRELGRAV